MILRNANRNNIWSETYLLIYSFKRIKINNLQLWSANFLKYHSHIHFLSMKFIEVSLKSITGKYAFEFDDDINY